MGHTNYDTATATSFGQDELHGKRIHGESKSRRDEKETEEERDIGRKLAVLSEITSFMGFHEYILVRLMQRCRSSITLASHMHTKLGTKEISWPIYTTQS